MHSAVVLASNIGIRKRGMATVVPPMLRLTLVVDWMVWMVRLFGLAWELFVFFGLKWSAVLCGDVLMCSCAELWRVVAGHGFV